MRVTRKMIHKDVRISGTILRLFTSNVTEASCRKHHASELKHIDKKKPRRSEMEKVYIRRQDGSDMRVMILKPRHRVENVPAVLYLHGGGYMLGYPEGEIPFMEKLMEQADCIMVSPDYMLALDKPYPAALQDAYSALLWLKSHARSLGANPNQIFVAGGSAGGGLTAALAIYARDMGEVNIAFQMPLFPMLDDRGITESARGNDAPMWNSRSNSIAWKLYLGELYGSADIPAYAAPARLKDFSGLPPAYSYVGSIEPFCDETKIYFGRLKEAGVPCRLDVYPGGFHGFDTIGENKPLGREARGKLYEVFRFAAQNYYAANS